MNGLTVCCDYRNVADMEPANTIIKICGGVSAVSEMTGRDASRVHRWTYPRDKGGSDGLIPTDAAQELMRAARERGIPLTPEHFFPVGASQ